MHIFVCPSFFLCNFLSVCLSFNICQLIPSYWKFVLICCKKVVVYEHEPMIENYYRTLFNQYKKPCYFGWYRAIRKGSSQWLNEWVTERLLSIVKDKLKSLKTFVCLALKCHRVYAYRIHHEAPLLKWHTIVNLKRSFHCLYSMANPFEWTNCIVYKHRHDTKQNSIFS